MLKSQAHQNGILRPLHEKTPELPSFQSNIPPDNYSADDEEIPEEFKYTEVLDLSCKVKKEDSSTGVKRSREEESDEPVKKLKVEGSVKRKHLRKKRRDLGVGAVVSRPSVISYAGTSGQGTDGSSSSGEESVERVYRRRRRRVFVRESDLGFDVDEHFRRSLGEHAWSLVNGREEKAPVLIINDSIKPSDVDDHFAKALGSETWSKIIATRSTASTPSRASPGPSPPLEQPKPVTPPPPKAPQQTISNSSNFKIDALIGNVSGKNEHVA